MASYQNAKACQTLERTKHPVKTQTKALRLTRQIYANQLLSSIIFKKKYARCNTSCVFPDKDVDRCIVEPKGCRSRFRPRSCCEKVENCTILLLENDGIFGSKLRTFPT